MGGMIGAGVGMAGSAIGGMGSMQAAKANTKAASAQGWNDFNMAIYNQKLLQNQANEERAAGQQKALWAGQQQKLTESKLQANSAFGGGSATDTTVGQLAGQINQIGTYQKAMDMYAAESRARGLEDSGVAGVFAAANGANMNNWKAQQQEKAAKMSAIGSIIGSAGGLFGAIPGMG